MSARDDLRDCFLSDSRDRFDAAVDAYRAEVLAEAKIEVVAWLVKKASEQPMQDAGVLASKVDRGAVRIFIGSGHFWDAMDAHRAKVLAEAADFVGNDDDCDCGGCDSCVPRKLAAELRAMADAATEKASTTTVPTATPDFFQPEHTYQRRRWHFQCLAVAPNPFNGETLALGYLYRPDEPATATALDPDDWTHGEWTDITVDGA